MQDPTTPSSARSGDEPVSIETLATDLARLTTEIELLRHRLDRPGARPPEMGVDALDVGVSFDPSGGDYVLISHAHSGEVILATNQNELLNVLRTISARSRQVLATTLGGR